MPEPEPPTYPVPVQERWLVFYWDLDTGEWVMVKGRQFAAEQLARDVYAEYCKVLGPERSRMVHTGDNLGHLYTAEPDEITWPTP